MNRKSYKLLIFDWDGTLMDSLAKIVSCLHAALAQAGLPARTDAQLRHIVGLGIHEAIDHLFPEGVLPESRRLVVETYRHRFIYGDPTPARLFHGVEAMLDRLMEQGYFLAIATGKSRSGLDALLTELGLSARFHSSRCADETCSKPDPRMLIEILADLGVKPSQALMIGDTEFDVKMAKYAGMDAVAVSHGAHTRQQLLAAGPLALLENVTNLLSWLDCKGSAEHWQ
ncbi:MAG TPA: HAD-IIIA family hydrolase [Gammaproteobacteria bacterium]